MASRTSSICAGLLLASSLPLIHSQVVHSGFPSTEIPDGDPEGITLEIGPAPGMLSLNSVTLTVAHEWLEDLTVRLIPPVGDPITLFEQVAVTAEPDDSPVLGAYVSDGGVFSLVPQPYQFAEDGADLAAAAQFAVGQAPFTVLNDVTYAAQTWLAGPIEAGTWSIFLSDAEDVSLGTINSVELSYTLIPEPSAFAILAVVLVISGPLLVLRRRSLAHPA